VLEVAKEWGIPPWEIERGGEDVLIWYMRALAWRDAVAERQKREIEEIRDG